MANTAQRYLKILREQPNMPKFLVSRVLWRTGLCSLFQIHEEGYPASFSSLPSAPFSPKATRAVYNAQVGVVIVHSGVLNFKRDEQRS